MEDVRAEWLEKLHTHPDEGAALLARSDLNNDGTYSGVYCRQLLLIVCREGSTGKMNAFFSVWCPFEGEKRQNLNGHL